MNYDCTTHPILPFITIILQSFFQNIALKGHLRQRWMAITVSILLKNLLHSKNFLQFTFVNLAVLYTNTVLYTTDPAMKFFPSIWRRYLRRRPYIYIQFSIPELLFATYSVFEPKRIDDISLKVCECFVLSGEIRMVAFVLVLWRVNLNRTQQLFFLRLLPKY